MLNKFYKSIIIGIFLLQPVFGWSQETAPSSEAGAPSWVPPDIIELPIDWWPGFITENTEVFRIRADLLSASVNDHINGLDADNLVAAQAGLNTLRTNIDNALTLQATSVILQIDALPTLDSYSMQQLLDLRKQWRDGDSQLKTLQLEQEQFNRQLSLLEQRRDLLLTQYADADPSSPARLLAGLRRINLQFERYALEKQRGAKVAQQEQLDGYLDDATQKIKYATEHLLADDLVLAELDSSIQKLNDEATMSTGKLAAVQQKLLDAINGEEPDTYTVLKLKQQLTEISVEELLAQLKIELEYAKRDWFLLRSGAATSTRDLHKTDPVLRALLHEAAQQSSLWSHASQNTLVTPAPEKDRKAKKAYDEAQSDAHRTLSLIAEVDATIDNLSLVQDQVSSESLTLTRGFGGGWLRIKLLGQNLWAHSKALINVSLFHLGERPVTAGGIFKALIIFLLFWALSWLIRHILDRLERRQNFQQGSFYAGGRVLHYIILTIAGFVALGSIGLDFSSFALVAGALSVGIGFGLQSVVLNFVSGLILLFEGSIRVGDYVELDSGDADTNLMGAVKEIRSRATLINTNDNLDVIVPNSELVGNRMTNWTLRESTARMRIPFSVAYGTDKEMVKKAALEAAAEGEFCIQHTPGYEPAVRMISFGDNGLNFELRVWVNRQGVRRPIFVRSSILWAMDTKFKENGIKVPFPQRDLHLKESSSPLNPEEPLLDPAE